MSKIGDLFVKLGLKKDDYSRGLKEAGVETEGFVSKLKGIGTKAAAVWAAIGVGAVALVKDFAKTSQRFGDLWDQTMAGMKAAWNQFTTSLTNFDFNGFGQRIKNAFDAARKSAAAHDSEFEVMNSIDLRKAEMREELALLQIQMRNQNLSQQERLAAQKKYLDMLEPLYKQEADMRREIMLADTNEYLANAGLGETTANRDALKSFMTDVAPNSALLSALDAYNKRNSGKKGTKFTAEQEKIVENFLAQHDMQTGAAMAALATYYQSTNDKTATKVVDALENYYSAAGAFNDETRRVQQLGDSIRHTGSSSSGGSKEKTLEEMQREYQQIAREAAAELAEVAAADAEVAAMADQMAADIGKTIPDYMTQYEQEMADGLKTWIDDTNTMLERQAYINEEAKKLAEDFGEAISEGMVNGIQELMDQLMGLKEMDAGSIFAAFLTPLADMGIQMGKIIVAEGIAMEAAKKAIKNPYTAIAAGAALIAISAAAKSGLQAVANGAGSSSAATTYNGGDSGTQSQTIATEMTIYVEGRISGRDIVLSGQKTVSSWNR